MRCRFGLWMTWPQHFTKPQPNGNCCVFGSNLWRFFSMTRRKSPWHWRKANRKAKGKARIGVKFFDTLSVQKMRPKRVLRFRPMARCCLTKLHFAKGTETPSHFGLFLLIHQRQSLLKRRREKLLSQNSFGFAVISWTELYWKLVLPFVPL